MVLGIEASNIVAGGGVIHLKELLSHADPMTHGFKRVIVWAPQSTLDQLPNQPWLEKQTHPWLNRSVFFRFFWLKMVLPSLAKQSIDVLFSPGANAVNFFPLVTMCQNLLPFDAAERKLYGLSWMNLRLNILRYTQTSVFKKAQGIIFLTKSSIAYVNKYLKLDQKTIVIPHGIHSMFDHRPSLKELHDPIKLLYVSIIDAYKHQWNVAQAVMELAAEGYPVELTLVGSYYPPAWKKLKKVINLHPEQAKCITYIPPVPYEQLVNIYQRADIFVFASSCETFSLVLLEAMSSGLPIACADRDTLRDTLSDAGVYFNPYDYADIKRSMLKLMNDNMLREEISIKGYTRAQSYSWSACADRTLHYLSQVAKGNH